MITDGYTRRTDNSLRYEEASWRTRTWPFYSSNRYVYLIIRCQSFVAPSSTSLVSHCLRIQVARRIHALLSSKVIMLVICAHQTLTAIINENGTVFETIRSGREQNAK